MDDKSKTFGQLFVELVEKRRSGATHRDVAVFLESELGESETRYRCKSCWDTGYVRVVAAYTTKQIAQIRDGERAASTAVAACPCGLGQQINYKKLMPLPTFNAFTHVRFVDRETVAARCDEFLRELAASKRFSAFDQFNAQNELPLEASAR